MGLLAGVYKKGLTGSPTQKWFKMMSLFLLLSLSLFSDSVRPQRLAFSIKAVVHWYTQGIVRGYHMDIVIHFVAMNMYMYI